MKTEFGSRRGRPKGQPKTGGRRKGSPNRVTVEARDACAALVRDPAYQEKLRARLIEGKAAPAVEAMLWHYAYGKPKESLELTGKDGSVLFPAPGTLTDAELKAQLAAYVAKL